MLANVALSLESQAGGVILSSIGSYLWQFFFVSPTAVSDSIIVFIVGLVLLIVPTLGTRVLGVILLILSVILFVIGIGLVPL